MSRDSIVGIATDYGLDDRWVGVRVPVRSRIFSSPALGCTQHTIQWVTVALSPGVKRQGREADHSPPASAEVKENVALYIHSPIRLHGVVLN
jgi:desulfoferrodoxin (superoxide reductase-like protein)